MNLAADDVHRQAALVDLYALMCQHYHLLVELATSTSATSSATSSSDEKMDANGDNATNSLNDLDWFVVNMARVRK